MARSSSHRNGGLNAVTALDRVFRIAQQMRQADLPQHTVAALAAEHVGALRCLSIGCAAGTFGSYAHTSGWIAPNSAVTTALPRLGWASEHASEG